VTTATISGGCCDLGELVCDLLIYRLVLRVWAHMERVDAGSECLSSSVGIATGYGLGDRGVGVRVLVGSRSFSSQRSL
jgi:hypothetical protein